MTDKAGHRSNYKKIALDAGYGVGAVYRGLDCERIWINASPFYPAFYANMHRCGTLVDKAMKRLRAIWSEGTFVALKREHNLKRARKRGLNRMGEECLLSALALNLKQMVKVPGGILP